jgi:hypothetical protein
MNKKQTIQILRDANIWRRWGEGDMIDPKLLWQAIDNAIATMEAKWGYVEYQETYKKKYEDTQAVLDASIGELQFANLQIEALYGALDEIRSITTDPLAKKVAEMAIERRNVDKLIHSRMLFS